jgi:prevent-host-death family protein
MTRMSAAGKAKGLREERTQARFSIERTAIGTLRAWKLEEAKARFSEVVRRAREQGPQRITYRGKDAVVVIAVDDLKRLLPAERPWQSVVDFLQETALGEIDVRREPDRGRDVVV